MKLEKIITMANKKVRLEFLAMERSLRATGCNLPILVIPYNDDTFDLPEGSSWWNISELQEWLNSEKAMPKLRKYQCFLTENYQFVDADVCFIKNPEEALAPYEGFITSCLHWSNPEGTFTEQSRKYMHQRTTNWPSQVFNSGQFACSKRLYDLEGLKKTASQPEFRYTCIDLWRDQPSLNMLVFASGVEIHNLTLPPYNMQSTWVGDYNGDYEKYWSNESTKPYLLHWAGSRPSLKQGKERKINEIFFSYLTENEVKAWKILDEIKQKEKAKRKLSIRYYGRKLKRAFHAFNE